MAAPAYIPTTNIAQRGMGRIHTSFHNLGKGRVPALLINKGNGAAEYSRVVAR
jgi:hypothetical protein